MTLAALPLALEVTDNMDFGELIVGAGTLALAGITGLLAWKTSASVEAAKVSAEAAKQSADAAKESAKAERESVEAMAMPYVIAVPIPVDRLKKNEYVGKMLPTEIHRVPSDGVRGTLRVCLWNLGSGPAVVRNVHLVCDGEKVLRDLPRNIPIAARDHFDADIGVADWPPAPRTANLRIEYLHSNGKLYQTDSDVTFEGDVFICYTFRRSSAG